MWKKNNFYANLIAGKEVCLWVIAIVSYRCWPKCVLKGLITVMGNGEKGKYNNFLLLFGGGWRILWVTQQCHFMLNTVEVAT